MRKVKILNILKILLTLVVLLGILNIPLTTRQGINFEVHKLKMPLYIKVVEFIDRDYHYKKLAKRIIGGCTNDTERTLSLFEWTCENVRKDIPGNWPIIDDHVWSIIVRGYGMDDQLADVFTTLCVYAGFEARILKLTNGSRKELVLSAIKLKDKWTLFDPYHRVYFTTPSGKIATVGNVLDNPSLIETKTGSILHHGIKYNEYLKGLPSINFDKLPKPRAYRQNFFKRIFYEIKELFD